MSSSRSFFVISAALVAVTLAVLLSSSSSAQTQSSPGQTGIPVVTALAQRRDVPVYLDGIGTVQAFNTVTARSRVDGQIVKISFVEGQMVKKGDLLAVIDPAPYDAALRQAQATKAKDEATLANSRLDLARNTDLGNRGFASRQSVDTLQAQVNSELAAVQADEAQIDAAKVQVAYTQIRSPLEGRTGIRQIDEGNIVHAADNAGIVTITQLQPISVISTLPQAALSRIQGASLRDGLHVVALDRDGETELAQGTLALIDNQIDQATGTIRLKATFANENEALWPGEFVNTRLLVHTAEGATTIPNPAIQRGPNGAFVYVIRPDLTAEARPVTVKFVENGVAVMAQGIASGERVVIDGQYKLTANALVDLSGGTNPPGSLTPTTASAAKESAR